MKKNNSSRKIQGLFVALLCFILIVASCLFAYKKILLDFNGTYATARLTYTDEYGFCLLTTYYPSYQEGNAKGFAVINIPLENLITNQDWETKYGSNTTDSKEMLETYQLHADWENKPLAKLLSGTALSPKSSEIGKHGKYFIINAKDFLK